MIEFIKHYYSLLKVIIDSGSLQRAREHHDDYCFRRHRLKIIKTA